MEESPMTAKQEAYLNTVLLPTLQLPPVDDLTKDEASALIQTCKAKLGWGDGPVPEMLIPTGVVFKPVREAFEATLRQMAAELTEEEAIRLLVILQEESWLIELPKRYMTPARMFGHAEAEALATDIPRLLQQLIEHRVLKAGR